LKNANGFYLNSPTTMTKWSDYLRRSLCSMSSS